MASSVIEKVHKSGQSRVWLQTGGISAAYLFGGCYGLNDIAIPEGDLTAIFCPSPTQSEKWDIADFIRGTPGNPTTSLEAPLDLVNYLLTINCPFGLQYRIQECDNPEAPNAWESMLNFRGARITSRGLTGVNGRLPENNAQIITTADITFEKMVFVQRMVISSTQVAGSAAGMNGISFCDDPTCPGNCGVGSAGCQTGYSVTSGLAGGDEIWKTTDGGDNWTSITSPFASIYDDIVDVACKGDVVIIVNGTATGEVARSQDGGTTWQIISLPDAQIASAVFMLDASRVWVVGAGGYIWVSTDGGQTFTTQDAGVATTDDLNDVFFITARRGWAVGDAGAIVATVDGGVNWTAQTSGTANALNAVHFLSQFIGYAGGAAGTLVETTDGGTTWTTKTWFGAATDVINDITSCEDTFVFFGGVTIAPAGFIYLSVNGGATANAMTLPTNQGVNALFCCAPDVLYAASEQGLVLSGAP